VKCDIHWCNADSTQNSRWCAVHQDEYEQQDLRRSEGPYPLDISYMVLQKGIGSAITGAGSYLYNEAKKFGERADAKLQGAVQGSQSGGYLDPSTPNPVVGMQDPFGGPKGPQIEIPKLGGDPSQELNWVGPETDLASAKATSLQNLKTGAVSGAKGAVRGALDAAVGGGKETLVGAKNLVGAVAGAAGKAGKAGMVRVAGGLGMPLWGAQQKTGAKGDKYQYSPGAPRFVQETQKQKLKERLDRQRVFRPNYTGSNVADYL